MTKGDLERLEAANMIEDLEQAQLRVGGSIINGYAYYDIENEIEVFCAYDLSDTSIAELQSNDNQIKFRRLERD